MRYCFRTTWWEAWCLRVWLLPGSFCTKVLRALSAVLSCAATCFFLLSSAPAPSRPSLATIQPVTICLSVRGCYAWPSCARPTGGPRRLYGGANAPAHHAHLPALLRARRNCIAAPLIFFHAARDLCFSFALCVRDNCCRRECRDVMGSALASSCSPARRGYNWLLWKTLNNQAFLTW